MTNIDYQEKMLVDVYEGENFEVAKKNRLLGQFELNLSKDKKRGETFVKVSMSLDKSGILIVRATESHNPTNHVEFLVDSLTMESQRIMNPSSKFRGEDLTGKLISEEIHFHLYPDITDGTGLSISLLDHLTS